MTSTSPDTSSGISFGHTIFSVIDVAATVDFFTTAFG